jgi:uncharacterized protein YebE (UPF0316 family)
MNLDAMVGSNVFTWIILPFLIFSARVLDVSLQTLRIIFVSRGLKYMAPFVGFFEVIIWLLALRVIMENLNNWACYIAYGAGFAMGNYIGIFIEKRLAIGNSIVRIITRKDAIPLIKHLRSSGYGVTSIQAEGSEGSVHVIYVIIKRHDLEVIGDVIRDFNPNAFYTVEDVRLVMKGIFPMKKSGANHIPIIGSFMFWRKGK